MIPKKIFPFVFIFIVIIFIAVTGLACSFLDNARIKYSQTQATLDSLATRVQAGKDQFATLEAFATQALGSEAVQTARAFATREGSQILATLEAFATQEGPGLVETSRALLTEAPSFADQAKSALATLPASMNSNLQDIPVIWGEKSNFTSGENVISYITPLDFKTLVDFYQNEMRSNRWVSVEEPSNVTDQFAWLVYDKPGRRAYVQISLADQGTSVMIIIENR
jgi:hypothetical protein